MSETGSARRRVVVVGAGFAGLAATHAMAGAPVEITLIDQHNYHLFQPLLYQVATSALTPAEIAAPIHGIVRDQRNVTVFMDEVIAVDKDARTVRTGGGRKIKYDALVLATGARHNYFGNDHWARHAPGLKTIDDAFHLRLRILSAFENAEMAEQQKRAALLTFLIVGGGPTGVELRSHRRTFPIHRPRFPQHRFRVSEDHPGAGWPGDSASLRRGAVPAGGKGSEVAR